MTLLHLLSLPRLGQRFELLKQKESFEFFSLGETRSGPPGDSGSRRGEGGCGVVGGARRGGGHPEEH